jgi:hypothetical protein
MEQCNAAHSYILIYAWFLLPSSFIHFVTLGTFIYLVKGRKGGIVWTVLATYYNIGTPNRRHQEQKIK